MNGSPHPIHFSNDGVMRIERTITDGTDSEQQFGLLDMFLATVKRLLLLSSDIISRVNITSTTVSTLSTVS